MYKILPEEDMNDYNQIKDNNIYKIQALQKPKTFSQMKFDAEYFKKHIPQISKIAPIKKNLEFLTHRDPKKA